MSCVYRDLREKLMQHMSYVVRRMIYIPGAFSISLTVEAHISPLAGRCAGKAKKRQGCIKTTTNGWIELKVMHNAATA